MLNILKKWPKTTFRVFGLMLAAFFATLPQALAASVDCQANRSNTELVLYLYFPTAEDSDFPAEIFGEVTSPLPPFDAAELDPGVGSTAQYRNAITERVRHDFCEFDVTVVSTTNPSGITDPTPSDDNWRVVGIGGDAMPTANLYGVCCTNGFSRVWAGEFLENSQPGGSIDGTLTGTNSTLDRWANAIAGTSSHEPGHGLSLSHSDSIPRPTEDARSNHIMASGSNDGGNITGEDRAEDRHFSDTSFEILASQVGLYEQTLSNWDFINPNDSTADGLTITLLVPQDADPSIGSVYSGGLSPWADASLSSNGSEMFQGTTYDRYVVTFADPQNWNNGDAGEIPAGEEFHVGVGLTTNYIVRNVTLTAGGTAMELHPRVIGYTPDGSFNPATGDYHLTLSVPDPENGPLIVSNVRIRHLPRTLVIDEMVSSGVLVGIDGRTIVPWDTREGETVEVDAIAELAVANLAEPRAVKLARTSEPDCGVIPKPVPVPDSDIIDLHYCEEGPVLGLFPSARVYVEATVTDPDARFFDRDTGTMVTGPLSSRFFIQFPGAIPDLNENGVDDTIDIDTGICSDTNANGVCDEAEPTRYRYAAKLICGLQAEPSDGRLVKGHYATTINILNLSDQPARITKSLSLTYPPEEQRPGQVVRIATDKLKPQEALKVDCADVEWRIFPQGLPASYVEGYVTIESATRLDVTGVYSSRDSEPAPSCRSGEGNCNPHECGKPSACCASAACPGAPALSTTLDVEPIREHVIESKRPPTKMCPDLTIASIGRPSVDCPKGAGSCVTKVHYEISNIGNAASGPFEAQATLDPQQSVIVTNTIGNILPGQTEAVAVTTPPGGNCFDPDCTVSAIADRSNRVLECNEDNNTAQQTTPG